MMARRIFAAALLLCATHAHAQTGTVKTPAQMNTEINTLFFNNVTGAITPFSMRQYSLDQVASVPFLNSVNVFLAPNTFNNGLTTSSLNIGANAVSVGGAYTMSGAFSFTGTLTGTTAVTFPTSGTLATNSYTGPGTGTAARLLTSRLDDLVSAANWPLVCDGATDTTTVAQQVISSGLNIYWPSASAACVVGALTSSTAGQQLVFSPGASFFLKSGTTAPLLTITGAGSSVTGGTFNGNKAGQGAFAFGQGLIQITNANNVKISRTNITNTYSDGITFTQSSYGTAEDNTLDLIFGMGIHFWTSSNWGNAHGNTITRGGSDGIDADGPNADPSLGANGSKWATFVNNVVDYTNTTVWNTQNVANGVAVWGGSDHATLTGNVVRGPTTIPGGLQVWGLSVSASSDHSTVTGNTVQGPVLFGIEVSDTSYNTVSGNTVSGATSAGIDVPGSGTLNTLTIGNTISANNITNSPTGILLAGKAPSTNVTGNTIIDAATGGIRVLLNGDANGPYGSNISSNLITSVGLALGVYPGISIGAADVNVANNQLKFLTNGGGVQQGGLFISYGALRTNIIGNVIAAGTGVSSAGIQAAAGGGNANITGNIGYRLSGFMIDTTAGTGNNLITSNLCNTCGNVVTGLGTDTAANNKLNP